jgi:hypothetical protein
VQQILVKIVAIVIIIVHNDAISVEIPKQKKIIRNDQNYYLLK